MWVLAPSPRLSGGGPPPATLAIFPLLSLERQLCRRNPCSSAGFTGASLFERGLCPRNPSWGRTPRGPSRPPPTLPLSRLVPGVVADDARQAPALDDLAVLAPRLDRRSDLHRSSVLARRPI